MQCFVQGPNAVMMTLMVVDVGMDVELHDTKIGINTLIISKLFKSELLLKIWGGGVIYNLFLI